MKNNLFCLLLVFSCFCLNLPAQSGYLSLLSTINVSPTFGLAVKGDILYLNPGASFLYVVDISDPANPVNLPQVYFSGDYTHTARIEGDYLYTAGGPAGLFRIFDITNPAAPQFTGICTFGNQGSVHTAHTADVSYIANEETLYIVNTADKSNPAIVDSILVPSSAPYGLRDLMIHQNTLLIGVSGGVLVYDISNPLQPVSQPAFPYGFVTTTIDRANDRLYVANGSSGGHHVADISNPNSPSLLFNGIGGTASSGDMFYHNGYLLQTGPDPGPPVVNSVNLFRATPSSSTWREEYFGPLQFAVTDIIGKDSLFIVAKFGGVEILAFGSYEVSVEASLSEGLQIGPNPCENRLRISLPESFNGSELMVRDLAGKAVLRENWDVKAGNLDVSGLPSGMYIVEIREREGRTASRKFCKQ